MLGLLNPAALGREVGDAGQPGSCTQGAQPQNVGECGGEEIPFPTLRRAQGLFGASTCAWSNP